MKEPLFGSFTDESSMPGFSLESPVRTTGCGVLKDVYLAHSTAKLRNSLSSTELANLGGAGERTTVLGITRSCSMEGENLQVEGSLWAEGFGRENVGWQSIEEDEIVSAAKALTFVDGEVGTGGYQGEGQGVAQPQLVKSRSYSALNNAGATTGVGSGSSNLSRALSGSRRSAAHFETPKGFVGAGWTKKKEELVRTYFHRFVDLLLLNELGKMTRGDGKITNNC